MKLLALATATPQSLAQVDAARMAERRCCQSEREARLLQAFYRGAQVERRASVLLAEPGEAERFFPPAAGALDRGPGTQQRMARYEQAAAPLACHVSGQALQQAAVPPRQITHLVTVSCTGFAAPGFDIDLVQSLGLPATVARTHVGFMGCHGALNGLRVARAFAADPAARVLLCAVELCSLHFHYGFDSGRVIANALFADGAAAAVLGPDDAAAHPGWRVAGHGACLFADSRDAMTWRVGDHGFEMTLSPQVPELIERHLRPWLADWLASLNLRTSDIASWAVHPGGPRILDAVQTALGLDSEALAVSRQVLAACGNMSSPTVLFILQRLLEQKATPPCVALGFGPGLAAEATLLV